MSEHIGNYGLAGILAPAPYEQPKDRMEYAVRYHAGNVLGPYDSEGACLRNLQHQTKELARMGVPEVYWPVMVERRVVTIAGEWKELHG